MNAIRLGLISFVAVVAAAAAANAATVTYAVSSAQTYWSSASVTVDGGKNGHDAAFDFAPEAALTIFADGGALLSGRLVSAWNADAYFDVALAFEADNGASYKKSWNGASAGWRAFDFDEGEFVGGGDYAGVILAVDDGSGRNSSQLLMADAYGQTGLAAYFAFDLKAAKRGACTSDLCTYYKHARDAGLTVELAPASARTVAAAVPAPAAIWSALAAFCAMGYLGRRRARG